MGQVSRRGVLRSLGVSCTAIGAGCTSLPILNGNENNEHEPGALVVKNRHSLPHVVDVSVTGPKSTGNDNVSGKALRTIETGLEGQIPVDSGETKAYSDFLSGSVMYTVKLWLGTAAAEPSPDANDDDNVVKATFSPDAATTPDARGSYLTVQVESSGELSWNVSYVY